MWFALLRGISLSLIFAVVMLPLQWFTVVETPLGTFRLHQVGLVLLAVVVCALVRPSVYLRRLAAIWWLVALYGVGLVILLAATIAHGDALSVPVQQLVYLVGTCSGVVALSLLIRYEQVYRLRWCGALSVTVLVAGLALGLSHNHVQVLKVLTKAITTGSSDVIGYELYRPAFAGFGINLADATSQLRHEVFAGMLIGLAVGSFAMSYQPDRAGKAVRRLHSVALVVGMILLAASLSRAVTLAALVWPAYILVRAISRARLDVGSLAAVVVGPLLVVLLVGTGAAGVLIDRLRDPQSSQARGVLLEGALSRLDNAAYWGGQYDDRISSHNFVIDAWLRGGMVLAVLMAMIMLGTWLTLGRLFWASARLPAWSAPVAMMLALPSVRMLTIGAGLLTPPEWVGLGLGVFLTGQALHSRALSSRALSIRERLMAPRMTATPLALPGAPQGRGFGVAGAAGRHARPMRGRA